MGPSIDQRMDLATRICPLRGSSPANFAGAVDIITNLANERERSWDRDHFECRGLRNAGIKLKTCW